MLKAAVVVTSVASEIVSRVRKLARGDARKEFLGPITRGAAVTWTNPAAGSTRLPGRQGQATGLWVWDNGDGVDLDGDEVGAGNEMPAGCPRREPALQLNIRGVVKHEGSLQWQGIQENRIGREDG